PFGTPDTPGQIVPASIQARLKLTDDQKSEVAKLQKEAEDRIEKALDDKQKKQLRDMRAMVKGGRPPGPPGGGFGPPGGGAAFRATRYPADYAGLKGRDLKPGKLLEEMVKKGPAKDAKVPPKGKDE